MGKTFTPTTLTNFSNWKGNEDAKKKGRLAISPIKKSSNNKLNNLEKQLQNKDEDKYKKNTSISKFSNNPYISDFNQMENFNRKLHDIEEVSMSGLSVSPFISI